MTVKQQTCKQLVKPALKSTMQDIKILWTSYRIGECTYDTLKDLHEQRVAFKEKWPKVPMGDDLEDYVFEKKEVDVEVDRLDEDEAFVLEHMTRAEGLGGAQGIFEYGPSFDYVPYDATADYGDFFRWQLSWEGPSDELQFFVAANNKLKGVDYCYKDWFDGATVTLTGEDLALATELYHWFEEAGTIDHLREEAEVYAE